MNWRDIIAARPEGIAAMAITLALFAAGLLAIAVVTP
jgi:hypothetical protein